MRSSPCRQHFTFQRYRSIILCPLMSLVMAAAELSGELVFALWQEKTTRMGKRVFVVASATISLALCVGRSFTRHYCSRLHSMWKGAQLAILQWFGAASSCVSTRLFFAFLLVAAVLFGQEPTERRVNIILISID